ncbi:L-lactate dehydrogenase [Propionispora hippei]|uniref:L-lactate dehydrogenase n=1 Tax=Propionispora hippei DSM 15287 TaxID=1123003 RepID=A0A1M6I536_9FIRM|nr:L-lactate dehydrogenase [Propionispora hippei]SHJ29529.1 L-lactate dehydrogenase [Propionispora hippei DSM 15287]
MNRNKLVIVGVGHVGSAVLNCALAFQLASEIVLIDTDGDKAVGEALDTSHGTSFAYYSPNIDVRAGGYEECRDADVIIIAAGPSIMPGENPDRLVLADRNVKTIREVMSSIVRYTQEAVIIIITNPLDVISYCAQNFFGYPKEKILGTGTTLETARLRRILANHYGVDPKDVQGYMLGEHGNSAFPAWSLVSVAGIAYDKLDAYFQPAKPLNTAAVGRQVVQVAYDVLSFKGCTNSGIAVVACRIARAVLANEGSIFPVSTTLEGEYGLSRVSLSLPCQIGAGGVKRRLAVPLTAEETEKLRHSAASISQVLRNTGLLS